MNEEKMSYSHELYLKHFFFRQNDFIFLYVLCTSHALLHTSF